MEARLRIAFGLTESDDDDASLSTHDSMPSLETVSDLDSAHGYDVNELETEVFGEDSDIESISDVRSDAPMPIDELLPEGCHGCDGGALFFAYFRRFSLFNPASERPSRRSES